MKYLLPATILLLLVTSCQKKAVWSDEFDNTGTPDTTKWNYDLGDGVKLADLCPNVYFDTSSSNGWMKYEGLTLPTVFRRALDVVGHGRLLFGTDSSFFPRGWNRAVFQAQHDALQEIGVSAEAARAIFSENFEKL